MPSVTFGSGLTWAGAVRVYTRQFWANAWTLVDNLWPTELNWSLLPDPPTASFRSDYGAVLPTNGNAWTVVPKVNVQGYYVKVEADCADGTLTWVGFIDDVVDTQGGIQTIGGVPRAIGRLDITAYSMIQGLAYETLTFGYWWDYAAGIKRRSGSAIDFNAGGEPNRTKTVPVGETSHLFSAKDDAEWWTSRDIAAYLIGQHAPRNAADTVQIPWELVGGGLLPNWDRPEIAVDRLSVLELLNQIIDRKLFLGSTVKYNGGTNTNQLVIDSLSDVSVSLGSSRTLVANSNPTTIDCWNDSSTAATVRSTATSIFHEVIARGERRTSTMTLKNDKGIYRAYTAAQVTRYNTGASDDATYASASAVEKRRMNAAIRSTGDLADVFRHWVLHVDFNWVFGGGGSTGDYGFLPTVPPAIGEPAFYTPWPNAIELCPELELDKYLDYSGSRIADGAVQNSALVIRQPPKLLFLRRGSTTKYVDLAKDTPGSLWGTTDDNAFCVDVTLDDDAHGIRLDVCGAAQYLLGGSTDATFEFNFLREDDQPGETWNSSNIAWVFTLLDDRYAVGVAQSAAYSTTDAIRRVVVPVGKNHRMDFVCKNSVVDTAKDMTLKKSTTGGFIRDDTPILTSQANLLALWYLRTRNVLMLESSRPSAVLAVGAVVTVLNAGTAQETTINTPITGISLSLPISENGPPQAPRYTLQTAAMSFDPAIL